jgi:heavy metal sensor kinase
LDAATRTQRPSLSLRFRMTLSYALFFTILLTLLAVFLRQFLAQTLDSQIREAINQDWATLKAYLHIGKGSERWYVDQSDPEEVAVEGRLHRIFFLADAKGNVIDTSDVYKTLGADSRSQIRSVVTGKQVLWQEKVDPHGEHFLIRASFDNDEDTPDHVYYYVAIGRSLKYNREILNKFTLLCAGLIPLIALSGCFLGWVYAGRALSPVMDIARTAQRISGLNLSMRIPTRKSGDELDYLIDTFNRMIERLELSFNQIRQFSTDVSHELRTPITIVRGQLEVALFTAKTADDYREAIVDSLNDVERLSGIVRALLLLSQAETGQVVLQRAPVDLQELILDLVDQFQIPAESAQVRLSTGDLAAGAFAEVDRMQIERMLSNLLSNALKFTPPGGEVCADLRDLGVSVEIQVKDTGRGIAPEHLPHIFDRFYRVAETGGAPSPEKGLGLGLSFVSWIAKAHGGTVDVISHPGQGTSFLIRLPKGSSNALPNGGAPAVEAPAPFELKQT